MVKISDLRRFVKNKDRNIFDEEYGYSVEDKLKAKDEIELLFSKIESISNKRQKLLYDLKALEINSEEESEMAKKIMKEINIGENYKNALLAKIGLLEEKIYRADYNELNKRFLE